MKDYIKKRTAHFLNPEFVRPFVAAALMLIAANIINFYAGTYATDHASSSVTDIILSNTRVHDVDWLFVYGSLAFWAFLVFVWAHHIERFPFAVKALSLFIVVRSVFISLTHIGPFIDQIHWTNSILDKWSFGGDLFFSGHTGIPFLFALIFWDIKLLRYVFLGLSAFFGTIVLMGHLHYSIDVLSAFFITFSIYHMAEYFFKKDMKLFTKRAILTTKV